MGGQMKDANGDRVLGKTRWRRFGLAYGLSMSVIIGVLLLAATGAIALPVAITGLHFNVEGDALHGTGFKQWGDVDACATGATNPLHAFCSNPDASHSYIGVATTSIDTLDNGSGTGILNLTQTVCGPTGLGAVFPSVGNLRLVITGDSVTASNLVADVTDLTMDSTASATFHNLTVGVPLPTSGISPGVNTLGQTADSFDITGGHFTQTAVSTTAGTFAVKHLGLHASLVSSC